MRPLPGRTQRPANAQEIVAALVCTKRSSELVGGISSSPITRPVRLSVMVRIGEGQRAIEISGWKGRIL